MSKILVLGGASSGKSRFALNVFKGRKAVAFVATVDPATGDEDLRRRIEAHRKERPPSWRLIEGRFDLPEVLFEIDTGPEEALLLDSLTLYAGRLVASAEPDPEGAIDRLDLAVRKFRKPLLLVSDEVGLGTVPGHPEARRFRELLGRMNQRMAALSSGVYLVVAGIGVKVKGT